MARKTFRTILKAALIAASCCPLPSIAVSVQQVYEYDALGRLVRVHEGGVAKAGYCYDDAGNRIKVNASGGDCEVSLPAPAAPTSTSQGSHQGGGCYLNWSYSGVVAKFEIKIKGASVVTVDGAKRYYDHNTRCFEWIKACSNENICSEMVYI